MVRARVPQRLWIVDRTLAQVVLGVVWLETNLAHAQPGGALVLCLGPQVVILKGLTAAIALR
tara:strand:- start:12345 stop:12530 length:186 start_codon:yes stop_codon:yes gene_type:complete